MPGLPLGAAQQHPIPAQALIYEAISGIEFIEVNDDLPYPRSVAYRPTDTGAEMRVRDNAPDLCELALSADQARAYIASLVDAGLFSWQRVYRPAQGTFVLNATRWRLEVRFADVPGAKRVKPFKVEGENVFPDDYEAVLAALMQPAADELAALSKGLAAEDPDLPADVLDAPGAPHAAEPEA